MPKVEIWRCKEDDHIQEFLNTLDRLLGEETGNIHISDTTLNVIRRYERVVSKPGWQAIWSSIFEQALRGIFGDSWWDGPSSLLNGVVSLYFP